MGVASSKNFRNTLANLVCGFFAVGQFAVRKNVSFGKVWSNQVRLGFFIFSYGELSHDEKSHGEKSQSQQINKKSIFISTYGKLQLSQRFQTVSIEN